MMKIKAYAVKKDERFWVIALDESVGVEVFEEDPTKRTYLPGLGVVKTMSCRRVEVDFEILEKDNHTGLQLLDLKSRFTTGGILLEGGMKKLGILGGDQE